MNIINLCASNVSSLNGKDVYIYGAGEYAQNIANRLKKMNIDIKSFIVDDVYCPESKVEVLCLSAYSYGKTHVVINGIANVKSFRRVVEQEVFPTLYVLLSPVKLWEYDEVYFANHFDELRESENLYADDDSKNVSRAFLKACRTGEADEIVEYASSENIYFNDLTNVIPDGVFIDCGAYDGDSVKKYLDFLGVDAKGYKSAIYAFEPDTKNFETLKSKYVQFSNIHCIGKGVWDKQEKLYFDKKGKMASNITGEAVSGCSVVEVTDIDSVIRNEKVGFIKMDVEGSEYKALVGAKNCITRDYPMLAISAYHRMDDLISLPQLIKSFENETHGYKLYLRHHGICAYELVIYAIPFGK